MQCCHDPGFMQVQGIIEFTRIILRVPDTRKKDFCRPGVEFFRFAYYFFRYGRRGILAGGQYTQGSRDEQSKA
jgi:hypothetical protein